MQEPAGSPIEVAASLPAKEEAQQLIAKVTGATRSPVVSINRSSGFMER